jgi:hypothetical protein
MSVSINAQDLKVGKKYYFLDMNKKDPTYMGTLESIDSNDSSNMMHGNESVILKFEGNDRKKYNWDDKFKMHTTVNNNNGGKKRRRTKRKQRRRKTSRR